VDTLKVFLDLRLHSGLLFKPWLRRILFPFQHAINPQDPPVDRSKLERDTYCPHLLETSGLQVCETCTDLLPGVLGRMADWSPLEQWSLLVHILKRLC